MEKITYKEAMTRGQIKKALLFAETAKKNIESPPTGGLDQIWLNDALKRLQVIIEILKSICTQPE